MLAKIRQGEVVSYCPQFLQEIDELDSTSMRGIIERHKGLSVHIKWFGGGSSVVFADRLIRIDLTRKDEDD